MLDSAMILPAKDCVFCVRTPTFFDGDIRDKFGGATYALIPLMRGRIMDTKTERINIVKAREDKEPIKFHFNKDGMEFSIQDGYVPDWCPDSKFTKGDLRARIEPWLTSLFQSEHLSLLIGSGLTTAIELAACGRLSGAGMSGNFEISEFAHEISLAAENSAIESGRIRSGERTEIEKKVNIEDRIRVANELIQGLRILRNGDLIPDVKEKLEKLCAEVGQALKGFADSIFASEKAIASAEAPEKEKAFGKLVLFLMSFASRTGTRDRLSIFTTNYDRLIEAGADVAGLRLIDRFVGALSPIFRSSRVDIDMHYNPPGIRGEPRYLEGVARFTKLHGSLDWINVDGDIRRIGLPFGAENIEPFLQIAGLDANYDSLMIYPNAAKDRETSEYPYVELFRDFAAALCRPNNTLVTYGYSFGDDHINRIIRDMLTIPSTHLVIICYDDNTGRIMKKYEQWGHQSQISLIIGEDIANINDLVDFYLPKPSIDRASIRMADILRQRFDQPSRKDKKGEIEP